MSDTASGRGVVAKNSPQRQNPTPTERKTKMKKETTTGNTNANTFENVKRTFETAYASGTDYTAALYDLATAVAYSVVNKCIDPQRKAAATRETVSNSGYNPAMVELKNGISKDRRTLANTSYCAAVATRSAFNADGDRVTEIADKDAADALSKLTAETLTDGIDLVHTAAVAILEQAAEHATAAAWLDSVYTVRRLSKKVYIQHADSAAYKDIETTPIQEVYRAVRQTVQNSRATATDPRNGYSYIEEVTADGLDTIYYRLHKYADLGGYDSSGHYTTDSQSVTDYETIIAKLNLTDRQAQIVRLRMQGKGMRQIATYLGVKPETINKTLARLRDKCAALGLTPTGYKTAE